MEAAELYYKPWTYFWTLQSLGLLLLIWGLIYKFKFYFKAQKPSLNRKANYWFMFKAFVREVLLQKQLAQKGLNRWTAHMAIFYGFLGLLTLSAIAVVLETLVPSGSAIGQYMVSGSGRNYYKAAGDIFGLLILAALLVPLLRRYVLRDAQLHTDSSDSLAILFILVLVVTGFCLEGARLAMLSPAPQYRFSFVGYQLAGLFRGIDGISSLATVLWVTHSTLNAALLAYLPHSKFIHIINSPVEIVLNASEERMRGDLYL